MRKCQNCNVEILPRCTWCKACRRLRKNEYLSRFYYANHEKALAKAKAYEKQPRRKESITRRWQQLKNNAKAKQREVTISQEEFNIITNSPCHYCKDLLCQDRTGTRIDRVDNLLGYVSGNCVPCCKVCNAIKQDLFTQEETMAMVQALIELKRRLANENIGRSTNGILSNLRQDWRSGSSQTTNDGTGGCPIGTIAQ